MYGSQSTPKTVPGSIRTHTTKNPTKRTLLTYKVRSILLSVQVIS